MKAWESDMVEELKVEEKNNLFAIFPIGATMQDGSKRKRSRWILSLSWPLYTWILSKPEIIILLPNILDRFHVTI